MLPAPAVLRPLIAAASRSCCRVVPVTTGAGVPGAVQAGSREMGYGLLVAGICIVLLSWYKLMAERSPLMANATPEFDWSELTGRTVSRLREPKVVPVPESIKRAAQRSYDGVPHPSDPAKLNHILEHEFASEEQAAAAAKLLKKAGAHTEPRTSVRVVIDPQNTGNTRLIRWKAGNRTGAKAE